jgi:multidrug resistance efflux pump
MTAAVVGGAAHMGAKSANKQAQAQANEAAQSEQIAELQAQQAAMAAPVAAAPAAAPADPMMAELQNLANLHTSGILSDEEFAAAKAKLLGI